MNKTYQAVVDRVADALGVHALGAIHHRRKAMFRSDNMRVTKMTERDWIRETEDYILRGKFTPEDVIEAILPEDYIVTIQNYDLASLFWDAFSSYKYSREVV